MQFPPPALPCQRRDKRTGGSTDSIPIIFELLIARHCKASQSPLQASKRYLNQKVVTPACGTIMSALKLVLETGLHACPVTSDYSVRQRDQHKQQTRATPPHSFSFFLLSPSTLCFPFVSQVPCIEGGLHCLYRPH
jgi:hypothetical protein